MINPTLVINETFAAPADGRVYGIHSATQGFVKAYLRSVRPDVLRFSTDRDDVRAALAAEAGRGGSAITLEEARAADDVGPCAMFYAVPRADLFWTRRLGGAGRFAVCGLHHSLTGSAIVLQMRDLALAPTEPWDALICTSRAAKRAIQRMFEGWTEFVASRGGTLPQPRLQLPVIPLGIDVGDFRPPSGNRLAPTGLRSRLGIPPDALTLLFLGRLNFSSKAHPLPMFVAAERARQRLGRPIHLVQAGWYPSDAVAEATARLAREAAPSVVHHHIGAVSGSERTEAYAAADVFVSLADNVQETFGLTLVEAMASGLPVVATDWDGYRDSVEPGVTGFLVPTLMAPPGSGREVGLAHGAGGRPYNRFLMDVAQATSVDIGAAARAIEALGADPALRKRMGEAGRRRAEDLFDWSAVMPAYCDLWEELDQRRRADGGGAPEGAESPLHPDPFRIFAGFASRALEPGARFALQPDGATALRIAANSQTLRAPSDLLPGDAVLRGLVDAVRLEPSSTVSSLCRRFGDPGGRTTRGLVWLVKAGVLDIA